MHILKYILHLDKSKGFLPLLPSYHPYTLASLFYSPFTSLPLPPCPLPFCLHYCLLASLIAFWPSVIPCLPILLSCSLPPCLPCIQPHLCYALPSCPLPSCLPASLATSIITYLIASLVLASIHPCLPILLC
jgi:hypothetical protein